MIVNGIFQVFLCGVFGGVLNELLKLYRIRESKRLPYFIKSPVYWIITGAMIIVGGILTILYGHTNINAILAVNIGLSAPLILENLAKSSSISKVVAGKATEKKPELLKDGKRSREVLGNDKSATILDVLNA